MTTYTVYVLGIPNGIVFEGAAGRAIQERFIRGDYKVDERIGLGNITVRADCIAAVQTENKP